MFGRIWGEVDAYSTPKEQDLNRFISNHQRTIETKGRMQGTYLLLVICSLIVYGLFECTYVIDEGIHNLVVSIVLIVTFFVAFFVSFNTKKMVLICWILTTALLLIMTYISCNLDYIDLIEITFSKIFLRVTLVLSIGVPVGFRFLYNSIYTNHYPIYLENSLCNERELYEAAKTAIKLKQKDTLPSKYEKAFSAAYMDKQKNVSKEEDIVAICTDIYYQQIECIVNEQPSLWNLLKKQKTQGNIRCKVEIINSIPQQIKESDDVVFSAVIEYESMTLKPKIIDFCRQKGLNYDNFKACRNKYSTKIR